MPSLTPTRIILGSAAALTVAALLVACTATEPQPTVEPTRTVAPSDSAPPIEVPDVEPEFTPDGSAFANRAYFDYVNQSLFSSNGDAKGRDIIDNLVAAGFDKASMEVTKDTTPRGAAAEAIEFSVLLGEDCLLGQWGHGRYSSVIVPVLGTGKCLIGQTRVIDW